MMHKIFLATILTVVAASPSYRGNFDNFIGYNNDVTFQYQQPYSYHDNTLKYGQVITAAPDYEPFPVRYEHVRLPVVSGAEVYQSSSLSSTSSVNVASGNSYSVAGSFIKAVAFFILRKVPALIIGALTAVGICAFTSICSKISSASLLQIPLNFVNLATPERIHLATDFVKDAIIKYNSLQNV